MAAPLVELRALAQDVYLVIKNRRYDEIESEDGEEFLDQIISWANMYRDELITELDQEGNTINWKFLRSFGTTLGTAVEGASTITAPSSVEDLITEEGRFVHVVMADGTIKGQFTVVTPSQMSNGAGQVHEDRCTFANGILRFSRPFTAAESGGSLIGDTITKLTDLSRNNVSMITTIKPRLLLVLGIAKNAALPDIVQGKLSPSYVQKYTRVLNNAMLKNNRTSEGDEITKEDFSGIGGV